ncbi:MAG: four helix bundle protein [Melioribacteraceae bacterium]|nr:MAG: four helix bundle protein [Melioribacteraceae bacterium]
MNKTISKRRNIGLTSQIRRAAISIPANIVEGYRRRGELDKSKFLNVSHGSLEEVKYFLILAKDLNYINENNIEPLTEEVGKLLDSYMKKILSSVS